MKTKLLFLALASSWFVWGQNKTDWEKENLKGNVKSIEETYFVPTCPNCWLKIFNKQEKIGFYKVFFNKNGYKIREEKDSTIIFYTYDQNNKLTERTIQQPESDSFEKEIYHYDSENNCMRIEFQNSDGISFIQKSETYNSDNKPIKEETFDIEGNLLTNSEYKYYPEKNFIVIKIFNKKNHRIFENYKEYNDNNLMESMLWVSHKDSIIEKGMYRHLYNEQGDIFNIQSYKYNDEIILKHSDYQYYTYDNTKNWIKKVIIGPVKKKIIYYKDKPIKKYLNTIIKRKIEYY